MRNQESEQYTKPSQDCNNSGRQGERKIRKMIFWLADTVPQNKKIILHHNEQNQYQLLAQ